MIWKPNRAGAGPRMLLAATGLALALGGCRGVHDLDRAGEPLATATVSPERAAAIAEMRAQAEAGDSRPFPDANQSEQSARLSVRGEPRSVQEVQAIEAELALIAERLAVTSDAREIARLDARAKELRRLALAAGNLRR